MNIENRYYPEDSSHVGNWLILQEMLRNFVEQSMYDRESLIGDVWQCTRESSEWIGQWLNVNPLEVADAITVRYLKIQEGIVEESNVTELFDRYIPASDLSRRIKVRSGDLKYFDYRNLTVGNVL